MAIIPKVSVLKIVKIIGDDKETRPHFYILILIQREKTPTELAGKKQLERIQLSQIFIDTEMVLNTSDEEIPQTELAWIKGITQKVEEV